ncbi:MAG: Uncharacterised protein [Methanobacteriota archaeon]|nr:MAG: Uncharacterised protein [Euryarchaeota archaeon]
MNEKKTRPAVSGADLLVSNDRGMMDPPGHNPGPPVLTDVLVDGVPAKAGIGVFGTWSERIVLFFENEHPKYGKEWGTKYYMFDENEPGKVNWGHNGDSFRIEIIETDQS